MRSTSRLRPLLHTRDLTAELWRSAAALWGGGRFTEKKILAGIQAGQIEGALVYSGNEVVGGCFFGISVAKPGLPDSPEFGAPDWGGPAFFLKPGLRSSAARAALLAHVLNGLAERRGTVDWRGKVRSRGGFTF